MTIWVQGWNQNTAKPSLGFVFFLVAKPKLETQTSKFWFLFWFWNLKWNLNSSLGFCRYTLLTLYRGSKTPPRGGELTILFLTNQIEFYNFEYRSERDFECRFGFYAQKRSIRQIDYLIEENVKKEQNSSRFCIEVYIELWLLYNQDTQNDYGYELLMTIDNYYTATMTGL